jgi:hypothetical protein
LSRAADADVGFGTETPQPLPIGGGVGVVQQLVVGHARPGEPDAQLTARREGMGGEDSTGQRAILPILGPGDGRILIRVVLIDVERAAVIAEAGAHRSGPERRREQTGAAREHGDRARHRWVAPETRVVGVELRRHPALGLESRRGEPEPRARRPPIAERCEAVVVAQVAVRAQRPVSEP